MLEPRLPRSKIDKVIEERDPVLFSHHGFPIPSTLFIPARLTSLLS